MINIIKYNSLGTATYGWLNVHYHFSFAHYHNPSRMGFGVIRVINDDIIKAGYGFNTHPHRNMEIITYVRQGEIIHRDSMGNHGSTPAGDVQVMSAGNGINHSEYASATTDTMVYQIWIHPNQRNVKPRWDQRKFPKEFIDNRLNLLVSGNKNDDSLFIHQDAEIYAGRLKSDSEITHSIKNQAYVLISEGDFIIDGHRLNKGDGAEITNQDDITIKAITDSEILIIDAPEKNLINQE